MPPPSHRGAFAGGGKPHHHASGKPTFQELKAEKREQKVQHAKDSIDHKAHREQQQLRFKKKWTSSKPRPVGNGTDPLVTVVVHGFPCGRDALAEIYGRTVQQRVPHVRAFSFPEIIEEPESASLLFTVENKSAARELRSRLHHSTCYGRDWAVTVCPIAATTCRPVPCVVDATLSLPMPVDFVEGILRPMPGLLDVSHAADGVARGTPDIHYVATFADEGSALHCRAVLSGRRHDGGVFMFLKRRPIVLGTTADDATATAVGVPAA